MECAKTTFQNITCISEANKLVALVLDISPVQPGSCCLTKDVSELFNGKCWDCFVKPPGLPEGTVFQCQDCMLAISHTSDKNLKSKCWKCFLKQAEDESVPVPALLCKNLTAAHIACPNPRNSSTGGVYCDSCRDKIKPTGARLCRNAASPYLTLDFMGSHVGCPYGGQTGEHGFCVSCSGQQALPLCLNYANARVLCEGVSKMAPTEMKCSVKHVSLQ